MILKFIKNELSFLIALITLTVFLITGNFSLINPSLLMQVLLFIVVFTVIMFASMGVVHHAELLAGKLGEPYGTLVLTFSAVTVEIIMVSAMMLHGEPDSEVARDTVFSTLMILLNGLTGLIMFIGGLKYGEQKYNIKSSNSFFSMIFGIVGIGMFLPHVISGKTYHIYEIFLIIICILLYAFFIRMQTFEHNYYFKFENSDIKRSSNEKSQAKSDINAFYHSFMLIATIASISVLAESLSVFVDDVTDSLQLPVGVAGLVIALVIASPEGLTAIRAGWNNDMQRVVNISLGSILSTVSLTIPAILG